MPLKRCRNFESNGARKTWPNGSEMKCHLNCQFVHPSDPGWDRASSAPGRGRGGPPQGGRGRGQSSFGPPASGANASALSQEWGNSSATWNDYVTSFDHNPRATSGSRGAPSRRSDQTRAESSGWGSSGADGPGWGSSANNNENPSNGWLNEPGASGEQTSSSQWDTHASEWGPSGDGWGSSGNGLESSGNAWGSSGNRLQSSGDGWGSSGNDWGPGSEWGSAGNAWGSGGTDRGPGWGETSISDQGRKAPPSTAVAKIAEPDAALGGTKVDGNSDAATVTTRSTWVSIAVAPAPDSDVQETGSAQPERVAIPLIPISGELDRAHNEERGKVTSDPAIPLASKSVKKRPPHVDHDNHFISTLSDTDNMGLAIAVTMKMRELDAELSQLSALSKSRQVLATRAAKELLQNKIHIFTGARVATEEEDNFCSEKLSQRDFLSRSNVQHALVTLGRDNERLERFNDWVSRAETCLSHVRPLSRPNSPIKSKEATSTSKLNQLKGRSETLGETILQGQDQEIYSILLDHLIQDKMDPIVAAIVKSLDIGYNHLVSTSFIPLQSQGEMWQQTLQSQAETFAQVLLQSDQLKKKQKNPFGFQQKEKENIQQLQAHIDQKKLQLQVLQEDIAHLHHMLTLMKQQQQNAINIDTLDEDAKHIQEYIQRYIQANATLFINAELSKAMIQFTAAELKIVEKVWKTLQPLSQMSLWLQHSDFFYKAEAEEEMEIKEIEDSLLA